MGKDPKQYEFLGELFKGPRGGYYIRFPLDTAKEFGSRKQVKVRVWFDGYMERKSLLPGGDGTHWISVAQQVRNIIGKSDGDIVKVVVEKDTDPRVVDLPEDLLWLLDNEPDVKMIYMRQSYSTRKFFTDWIAQAKDPDIRVNRINRLFEYLQRHANGTAPLPGDKDTE
jgi:hypothetical protein